MPQRISVEEVLYEACSENARLFQHGEEPQTKPKKATNSKCKYFLNLNKLSKLCLGGLSIN